LKFLRNGANCKTPNSVTRDLQGYSRILLAGIQNKYWMPDKSIWAKISFYEQDATGAPHGEILNFSNHPGPKGA
jgi:hypothetical protein